MRIITYLCCFLVLTISHAVRASLISFDTRHLLIDYTKTKSSPVRSKSSYSKYTKVWFIVNDDSLTFGGNNSGSSVGMPNLTPTKADTGCTAEAYPYTTDMTVQNCASTAQCFDGSTYRMKCTSCKGRMALKNGRCSCANADYIYDEVDNSCGAAEFDVSGSDSMCSEFSRDGFTKTYYKSCRCPSIYQYTCNGLGQSPVGEGCSVNDEPTKYVNCLCEAKYAQSCTLSGTLPSGAGCYDTINRMTLYQNCFSLCDVNQGQVGDYDDYWCDHLWVEFPNIREFLKTEVQ